MRIYLLRTVLLFFVICSVPIHSEKSNQILNNWKYRANQPSVEYDETADFVRPNETHLKGIPRFLSHPQPLYYVYEDRPVTLECVAEPVSHVNIVCNDVTTFPYKDNSGTSSGSGRLRVYKTNSLNEPDSEGIRWRFSVELTYRDLSVWFKTFSCVCEAWNQVPSLQQAKKVHSRVAELREAYLKPEFRKVPQSVRVSPGQRLLLSCVPPEGRPQPAVEWLRNGIRIPDSVTPTRGMPSIEEGGHQLVLDRATPADAGNYSCASVIRVGNTELRRIPSPVAVVTVALPENKKKNIVWGKWSVCDDKCKKRRARVCFPGRTCVKEVQLAQCSTTECKVSNTKIQDARDIAMYVGLFIAVSVLVMVLTVVFCLLRRRAFLNLGANPHFPLGGANGNNGNYDAKASLMKGGASQPASNAIKFLPQHSHHHQQQLLPQLGSYAPPTLVTSHSPPNLPPPTCLSDIGSSSSSGNTPNVYSNGHDLSYNSTTAIASAKFSQPLLPPTTSTLAGSLTNTTRQSKTNSSCNTGSRIEQPSSGADSRPQSGLYHELTPEEDEVSHNDDSPGAQNMAQPSTLAWSTMTVVGGRICLPQSAISLTVPPGSFTSSQGPMPVFLSVCRCDPNPPRLSDNETLLSPIVMFGPAKLPLLKPCVIGLPHSADLRQGNWVVRLMGSPLPSSLTDSGSTDAPGGVSPESSNWKVITTIGCESEATPAYTHLDPLLAYSMLEEPQRLCLVGQSYPGGRATKRLRLAVFGRPPTPSGPATGPGGHYNVRIYVLADTKEAFDHVTGLETELGSRLLDSTRQLSLTDGGGSLYFCIEELSTGWRSQLAAKYQEIPFQDVWNGSQSETLHCAFTFDNIDPRGQTGLLCRIAAYQSGFYADRQSMTVRQDGCGIVGSTRGEGCLGGSHLQRLLTSRPDPLAPIFRIPTATRKKLCGMLDSFTTRGNDWRQLCRQLNLNGYNDFFLAKVSPTDAVLTLWEARNRHDNALNDLVSHLKSIGRLDCASLLESDCSSS